MSTKVKKPAKAEKKAPAKPEKASKKEAKAATAPKGKKVEAKDADAETPASPAPELGPDGMPIDVEEMEEQQAEAASSAKNSDAAALAAAGGATEMSASFKNFRHHPDMENFYRFIFDNDLRHEALEIIDQIIADKKAKKLTKGART